MHELSVALSLLRVVADAVPAGERVIEVRVRLGALSGVSATALECAFGVAAAGTAAAGARLEIEAVPVRLWCAGCAAEVEAAPRAMRCPYCEAPGDRLIAGRELEVAWIRVDDAAPATSAPAPAPATA